MMSEWSVNVYMSSEVTAATFLALWIFQTGPAVSVWAGQTSFTDVVEVLLSSYIEEQGKELLVLLHKSSSLCPH